MQNDETQIRNHVINSIDILKKKKLFEKVV